MKISMMLVNNCLVIKVRLSVLWRRGRRLQLLQLLWSVVVWKELLHDVMLVVPDPFVEARFSKLLKKILGKS